MSKSTLKPGVVTGEGYIALVEAAKSGGYALPAVNVTGTNTINAVMACRTCMTQKMKRTTA